MHVGKNGSFAKSVLLPYKKVARNGQNRTKTDFGGPKISPRLEVLVDYVKHVVLYTGHYRPEFWQMTNMEYLYGLGGVGVLSIEYSYPTSLQCL